MAITAQHRERYARIQALIFDLDDTLYLERDYVRSGFRAAARWLAQHLPGITNQSLQETAQDFENAMWQAFAQDPHRVFDLLAEKLGPECLESRERLVRQLVGIYRYHQPDIRLSEDAARMLPLLARTYPLGLITDGDPARQHRKIARLGIRRFFTEVIVTGVNPKWAKPSVIPFYLICNRLRCPPESCAYIADNPPKDFAGPHKLNMPCIRVRRPQGFYGCTEPTPDSTYDTEIADLRELTALLGECLQNEDQRFLTARPNPMPNLLSSASSPHRRR